MPIGLLGRKAGMTRLFTDAGESIPVTVVVVEPNRVTCLKTSEKDGYRAVQLTAGIRKPSRLSKPQAGHLAKNGVEAGEGLWEFRLDDGEGDELAPGSTLDVTAFTAGQKIDAVGTSIGKGYAGVVKRHNFQHSGRITRKFAGAPRARLDWPESDAGTRVQGQADGRAYGCRAPDGTESRDRTDSTKRETPS